jgi:hypothetical protein
MMQPAKTVTAISIKNAVVNFRIFLLRQVDLCPYWTSGALPTPPNERRV